MPLKIDSNNRIHYFALLALFISLAAAILERGSVTPFTTSTTSIGIWLAGLVFFLNRVIQKKNIAIPYLALPLLLTLAYGLSMLLPVPMWLGHALSPEHFTQIAFAQTNLSQEASKLVLQLPSFNAPETAHRVVQLFAALIIIIFLSDRFRDKSTLRFGSMCMLGITCLTLLVSYGHAFIGAKKAWSMDGSATSPLFAPLVNTNHLASLFGLLAFILLAAGLDSRDKLEKFWYYLFSTLAGCSVLLTLSRGAILIFIFMALAFFALSKIIVLIREKSIEVSRTSIIASSTFLFGILAALYIAQETIFLEMQTLNREGTESAKWMIYEPFWELFKQNWLLGTGQGGLRNAFFSTLESDSAVNMIFANIDWLYFENIFLQTWIDHGAIKTFLLFASLVWVLTKLHKNHVHSLPLLASWCGLSFLLLKELVDYSSEGSAILWVTAVLLAMISSSYMRHNNCYWRVKPKIILYSFSLLTLLVVPLAVYAVDSDHRRLGDAIDQNPEDKKILEKAIARHPDEAFFLYRMARFNRLDNNASAALTFAKAAQKRKPISFRINMEMARSHLLNNELTAAYEAYKKAWVVAPQKAHEILNELLMLYPSQINLLNALPQYNAEYLFPYCTFLDRKFGAKYAYICTKRIVGMEDATKGHLAYSAKLSLSQNKPLEAYQILSKRMHEDPTSAAYQHLFIQAEKQLEGPKQALLISDKWRTKYPESCRFFYERYDIAKNAKDRKRAISALKKLESCPDYYHARIQALKLRMHESFGEHGNALKVLRALNAKPTPDLGYQIQQANKELSLGFVADAKKTFEKMLRKHPSHDGVIQIGKRIAQIERNRNDANLRKLQDF